MAKKIIMHVDDDETQIAILEDNKLVEFYVEREEAQRIVGNIYKGKVTNVLPGMQSAFIDVGLDKDVFLHIDDYYIDGIEKDDIISRKDISIRDVLQVGQEIIVQIMKDPLGTKGARGTTYLTLPGRFCVLLLNEKNIGVSRRITDENERARLKAIGEKYCPKDMGLIIRTAASNSTSEITEEDIEADIKFLLQLWDKISMRIQKAAPCTLIHSELNIEMKILRDLFTSDVNEIYIDSEEQFLKLREYFEFVSARDVEKLKLYKDDIFIFDRMGISDQIEKALKTHVRLNCGGYIIIQKTEALTAIDVNTGKFIGDNNLEDTVFKTNLEAAYEIANQIKVRGIGGIIIIDFIDMHNEEHKQKIMEVINECFKNDKSKNSIIGVTEFGLVEITRERVTKSINEVLLQSCPYCRGSGKVYAFKLIANKVKNEVIKLSKMSNANKINITIHPEVANYILGEDGEKLKLFEMRLGKSINIKPDETYHLEQILINLE